MSPGRSRPGVPRVRAHARARSSRRPRRSSPSAASRTTRLEDVAAAVGIRRASHRLLLRRQARALRRRARRRVRRPARARSSGAARAGGALAARAERGRLGLDRLHRRAPALARILLREVADAAPERAAGCSATRGASSSWLARCSPSSASDPLRAHGADRSGAPRERHRGRDRVLRRGDARAAAGLGRRSARPSAARRAPREVLRIARRLLGTSLRAKPRRHRCSRGSGPMRQPSDRDRPVRALQPRAGHGPRAPTRTRVSPRCARQRPVQRIKLDDMASGMRHAGPHARSTATARRSTWRSRTTRWPRCCATASASRRPATRARMGLVMGHTILEMDEPEHAPLPRADPAGLHASALERWEHELVRRS